MDGERNEPPEMVFFDGVTYVLVDVVAGGEPLLKTDSREQMIERAGEGKVADAEQTLIWHLRDNRDSLPSDHPAFGGRWDPQSLDFDRR
jgi:hypothetical protein